MHNLHQMQHNLVPIEHSYRAQKEIVIHDLKTQATLTLTNLSPIEALISAYILSINPSQLNDRNSRAEAAKHLCFGRATVSLNTLSTFI